MTSSKFLLILLIGFLSGNVIFGQTTSLAIAPLQEDKRNPSVQGLIEIQSTVNAVYFRGSCETAGMIRFLAKPAELPEASPESPVYIRLKLSLNAKLGETLVWLHESNQNPLTSKPIFLPLGVSPPALPNTVLAPPDTLSIVRWKKGEDQIWLKIQRSPSGWVQFGYQGKVDWALGISARRSWGFSNESFSAGLANLPAATRFPMDLDQNSAVSTLSCLDLRQSTLEPHIPGVTENLIAMPSLFDGTTHAVENAFSSEVIIPGAVIKDAFTGDGMVGIGFDLTCFREQTPPPAIQNLSLCPENRDPTATGLVKLSSGSRSIRVDCQQGYGTYSGSKLQLKVQPGANYGFRVQLDAAGMPITAENDPNRVLLDPDSIAFGNHPQSVPTGSVENLIQIPTGEFLCSDAEAAYLGTEDSGFDLAFTCSVWSRIGGPEEQVVLQQSFLSVYLDPSLINDTSPFDGYNDSQGTDQKLRCGPSYLREELGEWHLGGFLVCDQCNCVGDLNCDFRIDLTDLQLLFNQSFLESTLGDLNGDLKVNVLDLILLTNSIGACSTP